MTLLIFIYGITIGSFLNVCIYRIPREESIAFPSSHCPVCGTSLKWYDNIPLFSYLFLGGRCRACRVNISKQYPMVELLNGIVYIVFFYRFGLTMDFVFYSLLSSLLIVITLIDLKEMIIPDVLVLIIFVLTLVYKLLGYFILDISPNLMDGFGGLLLAGGLFLAIVFLSKGGMGGGDVTLIAALGFILGVKYIALTIFLSFLLGAIISVFLLASKLKSRKDPIPFGPFIVLSFYITVLWGQVIINQYTSLLM